MSTFKPSLMSMADVEARPAILGRIVARLSFRGCSMLAGLREARWRRAGVEGSVISSEVGAMASSWERSFLKMLMMPLVSQSVEPLRGSTADRGASSGRGTSMLSFL